MGQLFDLCTVLKDPGLFHHSLILHVQAGTQSTPAFIQTIFLTPRIKKEVHFFFFLKTSVHETPGVTRVRRGLS